MENITEEIITTETVESAVKEEVKATEVSTKSEMEKAFDNIRPGKDLKIGQIVSAIITSAKDDGLTLSIKDAKRDDLSLPKAEILGDYDKDAWNENFEVANVADFKDALENVNNGSVIKFAKDITVNENEATNGNAVYYTGDKSFTIDLNGHTITANTSNAGFRFQKAAGVENTITIQNGKIVATENCWSAVSVGSSTTTKTNVNLMNLEISSCKADDLAVRARAGAAFTMTDCKVTATNGAGGVVAGGGDVTLNNVVVEQQGVYNWNSVALGVHSGAKMTVNGGTYMSDPAGNAKGNWVAYIMSSGGTLDINDGNFNGVVAETANSSNACGIICADRAAIVNINGGTFVSNGAILDMRNNVGTQPNPQATLAGGVFSSDPRVSGLYSSNLISVADGYQAVANGDGTFRVVLKLENGNQLTPVANYNNLFTDGTNYYVYDAIGLISMNRFWQANCMSNNMWGKSYNVMADIDATGYTWNNVFVVVGNNANDGFVFDGHGNTITGLNINGGLFSGTPNGGNAGTKPGVVKDITFDGVNVNGDHFAAVLWNATYGDLLVENVTVINSTIVGNCNVAALVGGTSQESGDVTVEFKNCNVSNNTIVANGKAGQDPNGAAAYISRAFDKAFVKFAGNNVSQNNQITNKNGLVGGGIYGYTTYVSGTGFMGTGSCGTFTDWNGISAVSMNVNASASKEENGTALAEAINASSGNTYLVLPTGEYKMPSVDGNKEITIVGTKDTVIDNTMGSYLDSAKVSFEGVTIKGSTGMANGNGSDYAALYSPNVTYTNCTFDGPFRVGRDGAKFINCTFTNLGNDYVWTYGNDVEFIGCTFETAGKAILIYSDGGTEVSQVTVKDCVFNATQGAKAGAIANQNCAAIEIHNYGNGVNLVTEGNTVGANFSGEWRIKTYENGKPTIIVNGDTYTQIAVDGKLMTIDASKNVTVQG